jgi:hypothetical protein
MSGHDGASDFDFLIGQWRVAHRRLKHRLAACTQWEQFGGTCSVRKVLGGQGNVDDNVLDLPGGTYPAVTLRSYDALTGQWSIWWLDGRTPGVLDPPMRGRFDHGVGTFLGADTLAGKPVLVRFLWTLPHADAPRWEQAFSADGGVTWETNWQMDFARAAA